MTWLSPDGILVYGSQPLLNVRQSLSLRALRKTASNFMWKTAYCELYLLRTQTMKKGSQERGIDVMPLSKIDIKDAKNIDALVVDATAQALDNYNSKVDAWNE